MSLSKREMEDAWHGDEREYRPEDNYNNEWPSEEEMREDENHE